ncbi:hypothetical protein BC936DRAFT_137293 [Jimgerdemannia flammicorona]|uniref:Uncharacterized protein n=1 Tax=Jimgerdemannia flammicorona TaxID=994334 RepID=A0A433CXR6_9FUNG|nr:hypothetical protein BC936DRAFT_137293 [Jimgerdemannia flammicorona]
MSYVSSLSPIRRHPMTIFIKPSLLGCSRGVRWNHEIYGMDCKAINVMRFGKLRNTKLPNAIETLPCLEGFFAAMADLMATLSRVYANMSTRLPWHIRAHIGNGRATNNYWKSGVVSGLFQQRPLGRRMMSSRMSRLNGRGRDGF